MYLFQVHQNVHDKQNKFKVFLRFQLEAVCQTLYRRNAHEHQKYCSQQPATSCNLDGFGAMGILILRYMGQIVSSSHTTNATMVVP